MSILLGKGGGAVLIGDAAYSRTKKAWTELVDLALLSPGHVRKAPIVKHRDKVGEACER